MSAFNLCLDKGNTRLKIGLFKEKNLVHCLVFNKKFSKEIKKIFAEYEIQHSIMSNTGSEEPNLVEMLQERSHFLELNSKTALPFRNSYKTPQSLGQDRIAAVTAAYIRNPAKSHLIIDAGSCITYDYIDKDSNYQGGNISPGLRMRLKAMHKFTGKLPCVDLTLPSNIIGVSTETAMQNGAILGTISEIDSFITLITTKNQGVNIILTGGDADFLAEKLKSKIFVDPNLVVSGLNEILMYNVREGYEL